MYENNFDKSKVIRPTDILIFRNVCSQRERKRNQGVNGPNFGFCCVGQRARTCYRTGLLTEREKKIVLQEDNLHWAKQINYCCDNSW